MGKTYSVLSRKNRISQLGSCTSVPLLWVLSGLILGLILGYIFKPTFTSPCINEDIFGNPLGCCFRHDSIKTNSRKLSKHFPKSLINTNKNAEDAGQLPVADADSIKGFAASNPSVTDEATMRADPNRNLILVAVMTAKKYIDNRIVAGYRTWATTIPGKVLFFSSEGSDKVSMPGLPVIALPGVDDSYPPQKKSFLMLKYLHDNFINEFEWFMRADDDLYIRGDKIATFLHSINSSRPQFIGQAGLGNKEEFGLLNLDKNENFCMGGPGIVMSKATLVEIAPHISFCLRNLYSTHEDVEIGRCINKFAKVACTWAFEMQHLFYHNHLEPYGSYTHSLKSREVHRAINLHPVKNHTYQYRMHMYFMKRKLTDLWHHNHLLRRDIQMISELLKDEEKSVDSNPSSRLGLLPALTKFVPNSRNEILVWEYVNKVIFSDLNFNPKRGLENNFKSVLDDIIIEMMQMLNKNSREKGRTIDFKDILYGYKRVDPLHGADYILDLLLVYRKHKGRKMTIPVRRHAYLHQMFGEIEFRDVTYTTLAFSGQPTNSLASHWLSFLQDKLRWSGHRANTILPSSTVLLDGDGGLTNNTESKVLHFLLPLAGRFEKFLHFMANFEEVCLELETKVVLAVMLYHSETDDRTADTVDFVRTLQERYPWHDLRVVQMAGIFSRGGALAHGASLFTLNALLVFMDVDIYLSRGAIERLKWNTVQGRQVYYPIVFSQYDPATYCSSREGGRGCLSPQRQLADSFTFGNNNGYWRQFGFGIASLYHSDFRAIGGFDTSIQGWGKEDVDLFNRYVTSNFTMFRVPDPGLVHIFHDILCDVNLDAAQYKMCLGTKASSYGSTEMLAKVVYDTPQILHRAEMNEDEQLLFEVEKQEKQ